MPHDLYDAILKRRSRYGLKPEIPVSQERVTEIIEYAVKNAPTAFNSQCTRAVVLFGESHKKVWNITKEVLRKIVPADKFEPTDKKINSFAAGYGTVLYFDYVPATTALAEKFPSYKDNFPVWAQHANGILQYAVWVSLAAEGIGASLQHYNPIIDEDIHKEFNIPQDWKLIAQMPFGTAFDELPAKDFMPIEERVKVFK